MPKKPPPPPGRQHASAEALRRAEIILDRAARRRLLEELGLDPITGRQAAPLDDSRRDDDPRHQRAQ